ncbi:hypothetical protein PSECIP111854_00440 [Pseudoalteromonas sp. CIP111854]|uniref:Uncharacterized protein n=1 Tax=Pseudoalteromonas holothuriae TaxID=2963714 RepID=A0A9W4QRG8_9GAMM|nr:hypothetical protein [Pseudoalteromonas sp. CIP111854]CAH9049981.1 hypothetical protein PSECIP111854_00440 [Pseudoalteromonas sp. CIP111854]
MKTSIKLNIKAKKLKELSKERAKLVGGAAATINPQQANGSYWPTFFTYNC